MSYVKSGPGRVAVAFAAITLAALAASARPDAQKAPAPPKPRAEDVESIDAILGALYDVISGPKDAPRRDRDRLRSLFVPGARLIPAVPNREGGATARVFSVDEFAELVDAATKREGFFEKEIARKTDSFGNIVHVFSTYESRHGKDDAEPFQRGINSIQLLRDGKQWRVVTIYWDAERPDNPIPENYLPKKK